MERLQNEIIDCELFTCLKHLRGESYQNFMMNKLVPVVGNVCEANLGMDADVAAEMANEVEVIVNSAASTRFDERYDVALNTNTMGPCRLLSFAKLCKKLQVFMHVSTAYVNGEREGVVLEKPFRIGESIAAERARSDAERSSIPVLDIEAEIKLASRVCDNNDSCCQKMRDLGEERAKVYGWQNTYVFTKAMGETMLDVMRGDIPVVIVRPSVIESISNEPLPGWIQGNRMLDPLILSYGKGQLPGFLLDPQAVIDVVTNLTHTLLSPFSVPA
uniref:Fatty acyl-CoA reductase n=1 Tax=Kalanchoe fedtschenkoi TaxID=63787 RepID=A0A7N0VJJ0_KALFE